MTTSSPERHGQSEEISASYEFGSSADAALGAVKSTFPKSYKLVREAPDELNYARTDVGDSMYVTVQFSATPGGKTLAKVLVRSLPS